MAASAPLGPRYDPDRIHHDCGWVEHRVCVGLHPIHWLLGEGAMIVCSCNVFSDHQVRSVVANEARRPRMSEVSMPASDAVPGVAAALTLSSGSWLKG